ncbi:hypothetical protein DFJ73DRAFT_966165, partial [Zopfochytrium polystomum]
MAVSTVSSLPPLTNPHDHRASSPPSSSLSLAAFAAAAATPSDGTGARVDDGEPRANPSRREGRAEHETDARPGSASAAPHSDSPMDAPVDGSRGPTTEHFSRQRAKGAVAAAAARRQSVKHNWVEVKGIEFEQNWPLELLSKRLQKEREIEVEHLRKLFTLRIQNPYVATTDLKYYKMSTLTPHGAQQDGGIEPMPSALITQPILLQRYFRFRRR